MSIKHPIVAVTGSSGAGTSTFKKAFEHILHRESLTAAVIEGDSFHKWKRDEFIEHVQAEEAAGNKTFSHFGPEANDFLALERLFKSYGDTGSGKQRFYLHDEDEAQLHDERLGRKSTCQAGDFTPWEEIPANTDLLFYEGLHGLVVGENYDVASHVDLGVGVVPIVNLEWIQKSHRDGVERGYTQEEIIDTILRRMPDYVNHITPQFSKTDINFQRVATVDTSNPFVARDIPTLDESFVVIRFRDYSRFDVDFGYLQMMIHDSFMSRRNTIVVPGGKMGMAMEIIFGPIIHNLIHHSRNM
ncbi:MAG: phosphoribulokinase [Saprospiraceae bacterium]|jgi:phosphoribulokinase